MESISGISDRKSIGMASREEIPYSMEWMNGCLVPRMGNDVRALSSNEWSTRTDAYSKIAIRVASDVQSIEEGDIFTRNREERYPAARSLYVSFMSFHGIGRSAIARSMKMDHATVVHYIKKVRNMVSVSYPFRRDYNQAFSLYLTECRKNDEEIQRMMKDHEIQDKLMKELFVDYGKGAKEVELRQMLVELHEALEDTDSLKPIICRRIEREDYLLKAGLK